MIRFIIQSGSFIIYIFKNDLDRSVGKMDTTQRDKILYVSTCKILGCSPCKGPTVSSFNWIKENG